MHAVMAVRAKEFEAQLQPADMPPHLLRQRQRGIEVRGVDGQIKRRGHGLSAPKRSLGAGGTSFTAAAAVAGAGAGVTRSEEHTSELQSLMRISYAVFCLKKKKHETHSKQRKQQ